MTLWHLLLKGVFLLLPVVLVSQELVGIDEMTNTKMDAIFKEKSDEMDGVLGNWQIIYGDRLIFALSDSSNNRMRLFTPVLAQEDLVEGQETIMLEANFHTALDAKYSIYNGFIISVYTHPLKELTEEQLKDALQQVVVLADNFGTTYSSTDLLFGIGVPEEESPKMEDKRINQKPQKKQ